MDCCDSLAYLARSQGHLAVFNYFRIRYCVDVGAAHDIVVTHHQLRQDLPLRG